MHFSVLLFHSSSEESVLAKYYQDATEEDGAEIEFNAQMSVEEAKKDYKEHIENNKEAKKEYPTLEDYMSSYHGYELQDGFYGYVSNRDSLYDWYEVGGRWSNLLPNFSNEKELKKLVDNALNMKNEEVQEKFRDDANEYIRLKSLPLKEAVMALEIGGTNSIIISEKISAEAIFDWWIMSYKKDCTAEEFKKHKYNRKNIIKDVTDYFISEDDGELTTDVDAKSFIEMYNYYAKLNKSKNTKYKYSLTVIDCHM